MSRTILAKRTDRGTADTTELAALLAAEGHEVCATRTATRPEHPNTDVRSVEYGDDVRVRLAGSPAVVAEAERRARSEREARGGE